MSIIDIANTNINKYSPEELLNYCLSGIVVCNGQDFTEFVEHITKAKEDLFTQAEVDEMIEEAISDREDEIVDFVRFS